MTGGTEITVPRWVVRERGSHAIALAKPMVGCHWVGEPRVDMDPAAPQSELPAWFDWEIGRYAAALLRKREPAFADGDLSHLRTRFVAPATVLFVTDVRCRRSLRRPDGLKTIAIAEVLLPDHLFGRSRPSLPPPTPPAHTFPREVPRLAPPVPPASEETSPMSPDNPSSRKRIRAASSQRGRT